MALITSSVQEKVSATAKANASGRIDGDAHACAIVVERAERLHCSQVTFSADVAKIPIDREVQIGGNLLEGDLFPAPIPERDREAGTNVALMFAPHHDRLYRVRGPAG
jgi:hypothetical protein